MNNGRMLTLVVAATLLAGYWLLTPGLPSQAQPAAGGRGLVAVVNVPKVFKDSKENTAMLDEMKETQTKVKAEAELRSKDLTDKDRSIRETLKPDSKDFIARMKELKRESITFNVWLEEEKQNQALTYQLRLTALYDKICEAITKSAQEEHLDLVLFVSDIDLKKAQNPNDLEVMISQRKVLYSSARSDITTVVLNRLNTDFAATPATPATPP